MWIIIASGISPSIKHERKVSSIQKFISKGHTRFLFKLVVHQSFTDWIIYFSLIEIYQTGFFSEWVILLLIIFLSWLPPSVSSSLSFSSKSSPFIVWNSSRSLCQWQQDNAWNIWEYVRGFPDLLLSLVRRFLEHIFYSIFLSQILSLN